MDKLQQIKTLINRLGNQKYVILSILAVLILFIILILSSNFTPRDDSNQQEPTQTQEEAINPPLLNGDAFQKEFAQDLEGMTITEESEFLDEATGEVLQDGTVKYTFPSENPNRADMFITRDKAIILARHAVVGNTSDNYKELLKKPHETIQGPTFYGNNTVIYFYRRGALIVDPQTSTTYEEFTFQPALSLEEFTAKYKKYTQEDESVITPTPLPVQPGEDDSNYYDF